MMSKIDVIIPLYKPDKTLFKLLDSLNHQTRPVQKIILMNTGKVYFEELIQGMDFSDKYPNVEIYHLEKNEFNHGGTRHEGVLRSDGDIFLMMTQDAIPADEYLVEKLTANLRGNVAVAYGRQLPAEDSTLEERISRLFNYPDKSRIKTKADLETLGIKTFFCSNVCAAYRREIYDALKGFTRHTLFNEDMIYAAGAVKKGYGIAYESDARVIHSHNFTNMQQLRRNFDLGVSQAQHPEVFSGIPSESEGKKLVKVTCRQLCKEGKWYRIPGFFIQCCFKYMGYLLGKHYKKLPGRWILYLTSDKEYWKERD